jgi:hypothetical protein
MKSGIKYLQREDIEVEKWNRCVAESSNGLCYADSFFLDIMSTHWGALIVGDYEAIMPLTFRKKYGINYLYQPPFAQQLGVISVDDNDLSDNFLSNIPSKFKYWDIRLNFLNHPSGHNVQLRKNYLLRLQEEAEYSRNAIRNIKTAIDAGITIEENVAPEIITDLHIKRFGKSIGIELLSKYLLRGNVYTVAAKLNEEYIASSAYIKYKNRLTFILNGNSKQSLELGATHFLKNHVIKKFTGSDYILDFEGSENPNFARFYEQFGAKEIEYYPHIINNLLPWPLKLFK